MNNLNKDQTISSLEIAEMMEATHKEFDSKYEVPMKHIYVVENEQGHVKIGISQDPQQRIRVLSKQGGFRVCSFYLTEPCANAYFLENQLHKKVARQRIDGEWFKFEFKAAVALVQELFSAKADFNVVKKNYVTLEMIDQLFSAKA